MSDIDAGSHLFISYSRLHTDTAKEIAEQLKSRGVTLYFDMFDDAMPGRPFLEMVETGLRKAGTVAVLVGATGLGQIQRLEVNLAIIESAKRGLAVVPVLLPGVGPVPELGLFLQCFSWIDFRSGITPSELDRLVRISGVARPAPAHAGRTGPQHSLHSLIRGATRRLIISGHTLNRFTRDTRVQEALLALVRQDVPITILQLNPHSPYAAAHRPFHELESTSPSTNQYDHTTQFLQNIYHDIPQSKRHLLDVSFTNYMPRFRTVIVDDSVYVYLYMYGGDVAELPDMCLAPSEATDDRIRQRVLYSTLSSVHAPETLPFIRCGQVFSQWTLKNISNWSNWSSAERYRHKLTHDFYVTHARVFHERFGEQLELEVTNHLDQTAGSTLVLGCGSGKEVKHIVDRRPQDRVSGVDFSHVAVGMARARCGSGPRIVLSDFYDLDLEECLGTDVFESVVANAAFVHLKQRDDLTVLLGKIRNRMVPGGLLFLRCLYKERNGSPLLEEEDTAQSARWGTRWFVYFSRSELVRRCEEAGLKVDHRRTESIAKSKNLRPRVVLEKGFPHSDYAGVYWSCVLARKPSAAT